MKIRTVEPHMRIGITLCEDCKERKTDGVFLQLGFFNGFICNDCAKQLGNLLKETKELYIETKIVEPPISYREGTAAETFGGKPYSPEAFDLRKSWEVFKEIEQDLIEGIKTRSPIREDASQPQDTPTSHQDDRWAAFCPETTPTINSRLEALERAIEMLRAEGRNKFVELRGVGQ